MNAAAAPMAAYCCLPTCTSSVPVQAPPLGAAPPSTSVRMDQATPVAVPVAFSTSRRYHTAFTSESAGLTSTLTSLARAVRAVPSTAWGQKQVSEFGCGTAGFAFQCHLELIPCNWS